MGTAIVVHGNRFVHEYAYFMHDYDTKSGTLWLLDIPGTYPMLMWESEKTKLRTRWHGSWSRAGNTFSGYFDCKGRADRAPEKTFAVGWSPICQRYIGKDYMDRNILWKHVKTYTLNEDLEYVCR